MLLQDFTGMIPFNQNRQNSEAFDLCWYCSSCCTLTLMVVLLH